MKKRKQFVITTLLAASFYFLAHLVPFAWRYQAILGLTILIFGLLFFLFKRIVKNKQAALVATFFPLTFTLGVNLFHFLFPQGWLWRAALLLIFSFGFYTLLLIENVFLVSAEFKTVPLYRAAFTVGFLAMLATAFFLFDVIFSFRMSAWANGLAVFLTLIPLLSHFFWTVNFKPPFKGENFGLALVLSLIISQISVSLSFWPLGIGRGSLYLVSLLYVFGGLIQAHCRERLFKKTILEFIWIGLGTFLALFLVTSWRGNF